MVKRCAKKHKIPVGGNTSGYYIITTPEELEEYKANLRSRAKKALERGDLMQNFLRSGTNEIHAEKREHRKL